MRVRLTLSARKQFLARLEYIHRENSQSAIALRRKVEERLRRLERFPGSGRRIPEFPDLPYREIIVKPFRFSIGSTGRSSGLSLSGMRPRFRTNRSAGLRKISGGWIHMPRWQCPMDRGSHGCWVETSVGPTPRRRRPPANAVGLRSGRMRSGRTPRDSVTSWPPSPRLPRIPTTHLSTVSG